MPEITELGQVQDKIGDRVVIHQPRYRRAELLGSGQVAAGATGAALYTVPTGKNAEVITLTFVNTHTSAVTLNVYVQWWNEKAGPAAYATKRRIIPKSLSLAAGAAFIFDYTITLGAVDRIWADASSGSVVDYTVSGFEEVQSPGKA